MACERVKSLIQEALNQRARHYQTILLLSIFFEGDQTGVAEDSRIFLEMVRSFGVEGEALQIPTASRKPGWDVSDQIRALIKQGLSYLQKTDRSFCFTTERVGFGLWWRGCSIFYLEVTGGAVLIRKTVVEKTQFQSTFRSRIPSFPYQIIYISYHPR